MTFYRAGQRSLISAPVGIAAVYNGQTIIATVPQGQAWIVDGITAQNAAAFGAVATVKAWINICNPSVGSTPYKSSAQIGPGATGEIAFGSIDGPFVMLGGDSVRMLTTAPAAPTAFNWIVSVYGVAVAA